MTTKEDVDKAVQALSVHEMTEFDLRSREATGLLASRIETVVGGVEKLGNIFKDFVQKLPKAVQDEIALAIKTDKSRPPDVDF